MKNQNSSTSVRIAAFVMILFFTVGFTTAQLKKNELQSQVAELEEDIGAMNETINELKADINRPFDDEYVAEFAQKQLGLCFPQEIIFVSGDGN